MLRLPANESGSQEKSIEETERYLKSIMPKGNFTFLALPFSNHTDTWILRDIPERKVLRKWFYKVISETNIKR